VLRWFPILLTPLLLLPTGSAHAQGSHETPEPLPPIGADWLRWPPEDAAIEPLPPIERTPFVAPDAGLSPAALPLPSVKATVSAAPTAPIPKLWDGSFELGLNGAEGNTDNMNFRFGFKIKRETTTNVLKFNADYRKATQNETDTADRLYSDWRAERHFPYSRWIYFAHGSVEYDEFQAFDSRVTSGLGVGYALVKLEMAKLVARCGGGVAREFGVPEVEYVPEAVFGADFEWKRGKRHKLTAMAEYTPDITAFGEYRFRTQAAWEVLFDEETNLSMKFSVLERYNSMPRGKLPNDVDYAATIMWKF
jgi:putative salt-induced outer membrane protein YdiY